jgi:hypothetical protein
MIHTESLALALEDLSVNLLRFGVATHCLDDIPENL